MPEDWLVLRNVWLLIDGNRTEVDLLIIAPKYWWIIEVKNYEGKFEYRYQLCYLNQKQIPDQLAACRNRIRIVNSMVKKLVRYTPQVHGSMIFINEKCQVTAESLSDCPKCYKIDSCIEHRQIRCNSCNHLVSKTEAVLRATCELGALFYDVSSIITTTKVAEFTGGVIHPRTIRGILKANLPSYGKNNGTTYHNYGIPYEKMVFPFDKE